LTHIKGPLLLTLVGAIGAGLAVLINTPLPFLLGPMVLTAIFCLFVSDRLPFPVTFPQKLRSVFIAIIGVMIGSAFSPALFSQMGVLIPGTIAVAIFVLVAQAVNYAIFRHLGRYDRMTAITAGMPGGLLESIQLAEEKGGNAPLVTAQQFFRVALVVTALPIAFSIWQGEAVGSAAGMRFSSVSGGPRDWFLLAAAGFLGFYGARALKIPAFAIVGPMTLSALFHGTGMTDAAVPQWLVATAQLVIGVSLGTRFTQLKGKDYKRIVVLGILSAASMIALGLAISLALHEVTGTPIPVLVLSFAPGGLIEMGLIALSLEASPVIVTLYHVIRIILTVLLAVFGLSRLNGEAE